MNIIVGSSSPPDKGSGINTYCREIMLELRRRGLRVFFAGPAPEDRSWIDEHKISLLELGPLQTPMEAIDIILKCSAQENINAVINNDNPYIQAAAPLLKVPMISVTHLSKTSIFALAAFNHQWVAYVVAISNQMRDKLIIKKHIPPHKVPVIYNGIDDLFKASKADHSDGSVNKPIRLVFNGGDNYRKGADLLLMAVEQKTPLWESFEVYWYGDVNKKYRAKLEKLPHITLRGRVSREVMVQELVEADIFLLPSRAEGCPMALIESMAASNLSVVSDGEGAMDTMVTHGFDGYVCNLSSWPQQLLNCLSHLAANPLLVSSMKERARKAFQERYLVQNTVSSLLKLIEFPTVDRKNEVANADLLRWHRPLLANSNKAPFLDRLAIRAGYLRKKGKALATST